MILVHGTSKEASSKIISSNMINPSQFDFDLYLDELFKLPSNQIKPNLNDQHVMWLGNGIYAFEATDYNLAKTWRTRYGSPKIPEKDCDVIQMNLDFSAVKNDVINFSTIEGKSILSNFLSSDFDELIKEFAKINPKASLKLSHLKNLGYNIAIGQHVDAPYVLGLFIEFMINGEYEDVNSVKIVKATFSKKNNTEQYLDTYICIKDYSVIKSLQVC